MHISICTARFEFTADRHGVTLRFGRRTWFWSGDTGLVKD